MFSFDGQIYEQIQGTAMGTKMAPSYANLFMDRFERAFLAQEPIQPLIMEAIHRRHSVRFDRY